ncbi:MULTISPECIES: hypothetical protein [unclassified Streptomyces]|uniref:hypothetical protein n=1 Tax=unclassified Streptomyces TaxID=2593676 RepID=UPI00324D632F
MSMRWRPSPDHSTIRARGYIRRHLTTVRQLPQLGGLFHGDLYASNIEAREIK